MTGSDPQGRSQALVLVWAPARVPARPVDRYGFDMVSWVGARSIAVPCTLAFPEECFTGDEVRQAMVMVAEARAALA